MLIHHMQPQLPAERLHTKTYLKCWHTSIFGYKLRTIEAENPKKLRTTSLNSEFISSYKKCTVKITGSYGI